MKYVNLMVKKSKLFALPKFGSLRRSTSASKDWRTFWQFEKISRIETGSHTCFTLFGEIFITYTNKIGCNATQALV